MNRKSYIAIEQVNDTLQNLFEIKELKSEKVKRQLFEEAVLFREKEIQLQKEIRLQIENLKQSGINIKLFQDDVLLRRSDSLLIRSYQQFVYFITNLGMPDFISFGYNLKDEYSGYDCAKWLVIHCLENNLMLPLYAVHSQYPTEKRAIEMLLNNFEERVKPLS